MSSKHPREFPIQGLTQHNQTFDREAYFENAMRKLGRESQPSLIIQIMERHPSHKIFQVKGCTTLRNLADSHAENQTRIASAEGIQAVVKAMQTHAQSADVQEQGLMARLTFSSTLLRDSGSGRGRKSCTEQC
jgi:hypothetical protein